MQKLILISAALVAGAFLTWLVLKKKENYGAMKNIRQIPFNDCRRICEGYRNKCAYDFKDADPSWCDRRLDACTSECYYTPYHQMQG